MHPTYRSLLETLKFSTPKDALSYLSLVSLFWYQTTNAEELWISYIDRHDFSIPASPAIKNGKNRFKWLLANDPHNLAFERSGHHLRVFSCYKQAYISEITLKIDLLWTPVIPLSSDSMLVFDTPQGNRSKKAVVYYTDNRQPTVLPSMKTDRLSPSGLIHQQSVYIFGGDSELVSAERLDVNKKEWNALPNMLSPHSNFTTVRVKCSIYILGGCARACEVFNIDKNGYSQVWFPSDQAYKSVSGFRMKDELVVLLGGWAYSVVGDAVSKKGKLRDEFKNKEVPLLYGKTVYSRGKVFVSSSYCGLVQMWEMKEVMEEDDRKVVGGKRKRRRGER